METTNTHRTRAAFLISGRWTWRTWNNCHASSHAAIITKARELNAGGYDVGNSDHDELSRWNFATRG